jgi:hypothetical protein
MAAFAGVLQHELARIGRADVTVAFGVDERTVEFAATDGGWRGPVTRAFGTLVTCERAENRGAQFWQRFAS